MASKRNRAAAHNVEQGFAGGNADYEEDPNFDRLRQEMMDVYARNEAEDRERVDRDRRFKEAQDKMRANADKQRSAAEQE